MPAFKRVNFVKHQRSSLTLEKPYSETLSLASLITQTPRTSLEIFHAAAVRDLESHSNHVRFALPLDENKTEETEPQPKRRRYQRRCSKTAAMMMPAATLQALDNLCELSEEPQESNSVEEWDHRSSLDVAEDLVQELHQQHELRTQNS